MSKNIVMQELTASGYEELYPKTSASEVNFSDTTINQFLGGGEGAESALAYLSNFGKYWWKRSGNVPVYQIKLTFVGSYITLQNLELQGALSFNTFDLAINKETGEFIKTNIKSHIASYDKEHSSWRCLIDGVSYNYSDAEDRVTIKEISCPTYYEIAGNIFYEPTGFYFELIGKKDYGGLGVRSQSSVDKETVNVNQINYIYSNSLSTYPDNGNEQDGFKYWYIGQPLEYLPKFGKIEETAWKRTGTSSSSFSLTFEKTPQFICVISEYSSSQANCEFMFWNLNSMGVLFYNSGWSNEQASISDKVVTFTWLNSSAHLNFSNTNYYAFAITQ